MDDGEHPVVSRRSLIAFMGSGSAMVWVTPAVFSVTAAVPPASQQPDPAPDSEWVLDPEPAATPDPPPEGQSGSVLDRAQEQGLSQQQLTTDEPLIGKPQDPTREEPQDPTRVSTAGRLARTGDDIVPLVEAGVVLIGSGTLLSFAARRRRRRLAAINWVQRRRLGSIARSARQGPGLAGEPFVERTDISGD